ncbi:hypothetical protein CPB84DRAFT_1963736 [Gymnopilus junonius]|uniref:F-box domain-containing protein n=1 Tax=Gymnopilus junonius TaxID=109634 RepID=A0A9P5NJY5_GYMJU|nr:hypothetical protein CPB84DRAFT_1963736 [Gymnopilus junonius]
MSNVKLESHPIYRLITASISDESTSQFPDSMTTAGTPSPAQTLPFDILSEIFVLSLPQVHDPQEDLRLHPSQPPFLFCSICRSWRIAALDVRRLWDFVYLSLCYYEFKDPEGAIHVLDRKSLDLIQWWNENHPSIHPSIYLRCTGSGEPSPGLLSPSHQPLSSNPFFISVRRLDLHRSVFQFSTIFSPNTHFENLVDLKIPKFNENKTILTDFIFSPSPNLRRLYLPYSRFEPFRTISSVFPWRQLTHIFMPEYIYRDSWRELMMACPAMECGAFCIYQGSFDTLAEITMPNLHHFSISCSELYVPTPFHKLKMPRLRALRIVSLQHNHVYTLKVLEIMLGAGSSLTELHLDFCLSFRMHSSFSFDQPPEGSRLSDLTPHLRRFVVNYIDPGDNVVGRNIIQFLRSDWLSSGWDILPEGDECRRLELIVLQGSYFTSRLFCDSVMREILLKNS